jgi:hypothetical protein
LTFFVFWIAGFVQPKVADCVSLSGWSMNIAENFESVAMASLMLSQSGGGKQMKSKLSLMSAMVGLAMLAIPMTASAKGKNHYAYNNSRPYVAAAPMVVNKHEFRNGATWTPAPSAYQAHEWHGRGWGDHDGDGWHRGWGNADEYVHYGRPGYYATPTYAAPVYTAPVYAAPVYGYGYGRNCGVAQRVVNQYYRDRNNGHPAAAYDLLRQNQWAFHNGCGAAPTGGLFNGFGGYRGAPAYGNYGYGQPNGGGSILTPFIQQYVR